jgi:hypothetical protein
MALVSYMILITTLTSTSGLSAHGTGPHIGCTSLATRYRDEELDYGVLDCIPCILEEISDTHVARIREWNSSIRDGT